MSHLFPAITAFQAFAAPHLVFAAHCLERFYVFIYIWKALLLAVHIQYNRIHHNVHWWDIINYNILYEVTKQSVRSGQIPAAVLCWLRSILWQKVTYIQLLYIPILKVCITVVFPPHVVLIWIGWVKSPPSSGPVAVFVRKLHCLQRMPTVCKGFAYFQAHYPKKVWK